VLEPIPAAECERLFEWLVGLSDRGAPVVTTTEAPHFRRVVAQRGRDTVGPPRGSARAAAGIRDGNGIMFVSHTGLIYPSGFFPTPAGHALRDGPVEVYRHAPLFRALRRSDLFGGRCGRCEFRGLCGGSRARALVATGDPLGEDPLCDWQPRARAGAARAAAR
jgi:MoaA/NifB/PqqE/SkfB family radical SAM enzyme